VDDCYDTRTSYAELLLLYGVDVRTAGRGRAALALCATWRPDVALLDLCMPGLDGFDLARQLREREGAIRLVAVTGLGAREYRRGATAAGFDHYIVKPVEPSALVELLRGCAAGTARRPPQLADA
jgi:two-component system CheB/CheR fusion protein